MRWWASVLLTRFSTSTDWINVNRQKQHLSDQTGDSCCSYRSRQISPQNHGQVQTPDKPDGVRPYGVAFRCTGLNASQKMATEHQANWINQRLLGHYPGRGYLRGAIRHYQSSAQGWAGIMDSAKGRAVATRHPHPLFLLG